MRESIIQSAMEQISRYGFRKFTVDDVAADLGISKKTIYKHFNSKKDIISAVVETHLETEKNLALEGMNTEGSSIDKLNAVVFCSGQDKPPAWLLEELQRYFPEEWAKADDLVKLKSGMVKELISRGVANGEFRDDINPAVIELTLEATINALFDFKSLNKLDLTINQAMDDVRKLVLYGILKEKNN